MKLDYSLFPTRIAVLVLGLALIIPALGQAQGKESFIQITGGSAAKLPLALPPLKLGSAGIDESAALVRAVVQRDLTLSGYFDLLADEASIEPANAGIEMGEFDFSHWQLPGAVGLVKAELGFEGDEDVGKQGKHASLPLLNLAKSRAVPHVEDEGPGGRHVEFIVKAQVHQYLALREDILELRHEGGVCGSQACHSELVLMGCPAELL